MRTVSGFSTRVISSIQSPPKGATIPYRPKPQVNTPLILANGQAYTIQGNYAVPAQEVSKFYHIFHGHLFHFFVHLNELNYYKILLYYNNQLNQSKPISMFS